MSAAVTRREEAPPHTMHISVIIPALNEGETIAEVIRAVPRPPVDEVIVVDNGSTDGTADRARSAGARVVQEARRGYGAACQAGCQAASAAEVLVFLDGDGSFDAAEIEALIAPIAAGEADLVLGSRTLGGRQAGAQFVHARFGNWLASRLMRALYGLRVTDLGPFRAIRRETLLSLHMREMTYGWPTEMMVKAARRGYRIREVPVSTYRRAGGRSKISGTLRGTVLAAYAILGTTLRYAFPR